MSEKIYYVVESNLAGYPQYLDGFRDGQSVWKADLQGVDPYVNITHALADSKKCADGCVRPIMIDDHGRHKLCADKLTAVPLAPAGSITEVADALLADALARMLPDEVIIMPVTHNIRWIDAPGNRKDDSVYETEYLDLCRRAELRLSPDKLANYQQVCAANYGYDLSIPWQKRVLMLEMAATVGSAKH
jgi:hypothetical protein